MKKPDLKLLRSWQGGVAVPFDDSAPEPWHCDRTTLFGYGRVVAFKYQDYTFTTRYAVRMDAWDIVSRVLARRTSLVTPIQSGDFEYTYSLYNSFLSKCARGHRIDMSDLAKLRRWLVSPIRTFEELPYTLFQHYEKWYGTRGVSKDHLINAWYLAKYQTKQPIYALVQQQATNKVPTIVINTPIVGVRSKSDMVKYRLHYGDGFVCTI